MTTLPTPGTFSDLELKQGAFRAALTAFVEAVRQHAGADDEETLTIAAGSVVPSRAALVVGAEGVAGPDDLTSIATVNYPEGAEITVRAADPGRVVTLKHAAGGDGQIFLSGGEDLALAAIGEVVRFRLRAGAWSEIGRSQDLIEITLDRLSDFDFAANPPVEGDTILRSGAGWVTGKRPIKPVDLVGTAKTLVLADMGKYFETSSDDALLPVAVVLPENTGAPATDTPEGAWAVFIQGAASPIDFSIEGTDVLKSLNGQTRSLTVEAWVLAIRINGGWRLTGALQ